MSRWLEIFLQAGQAWRADNVFKHSAAVSFYTLFSLAPITIVALAVAGAFLGKEEAGRQLEREITALAGPASARLITEAAEAGQVRHDSHRATVVGVVLVLVGATTVFGQLQESLNVIWRVRTKPSKRGWLVLVLHRLASFAMVLTIGFLLLVSLVLTTLLTGALGHFSGTMLSSPGLLKATDLAGSLVVITILFALMFKVMPDVRLRWRETWLGAALTAVLFTIGRNLIALYLGRSAVVSVYGTAGSLVALLIWVYYSCAILFYGAEFIQAYCRAHQVSVQPKETAVRVYEVSGRHANGRN